MTNRVINWVMHNNILMTDLFWYCSRYFWRTTDGREIDLCCSNVFVGLNWFFSSSIAFRLDLHRIKQLIRPFLLEWAGHGVNARSRVIASYTSLSRSLEYSRGRLVAFSLKWSIIILSLSLPLFFLLFLFVLLTSFCTSRRRRRKRIASRHIHLPFSHCTHQTEGEKKWRERDMRINQVSQSNKIDYFDLYIYQ